jgi:hypothetical protein
MRRKITGSGTSRICAFTSRASSAKTEGVAKALYIFDFCCKAGKLPAKIVVKRRAFC